MKKYQLLIENLASQSTEFPSGNTVGALFFFKLSTIYSKLEYKINLI
jgi:hypothetical protein